MQKDNIQRNSKGLHQDNSFGDQPKDTYRFALNTVNETELGDFAFLSNEESNGICAQLPTDYTPIGKVYIGNNETVLFLVSPDQTASEIGILLDNCTYVTIVNDTGNTVDNRLNFKVAHQIQAIFRLRLGCERTLYFTDDYNPPRYFNLDSVDDFKDGPDWVARKFNLFKDYNMIPEFSDINVLNSGGQLEPGGYNISIQYLDLGLNPTEWITTTDIIHIYNDSLNENYIDIRGSINSDTDFENFPTTTKAIQVFLDNLDPTFPFYRLAFIEATSGSGLITSVKLSEIIPTSKSFYTYTGANAASSSTEEEVLFFSSVIKKAGSIEQIENRLILANTEGKQVKYCQLQKFASRIKADCVLQNVILNNMTDPRSLKNPTMQLGDMLKGGVGYMPGEIYSFGIVYVFDDGTQSPVYHIPGKSPAAEPTTIYAFDEDVFPMSPDNQSISTYIDNDSCTNNDYWGVDSEGIPLNGALIRHHRFPFRSDINQPLVVEASTDGGNAITYYQLQLTYAGNIATPGDAFTVVVEYTVDGETVIEEFEIDPALYDEGTATAPINVTTYSNIYTSNAIIVVNIKEDGVIVPEVLVSPKGLAYNTDVLPVDTTSESKQFSTKIFGIKFSGIDIPTTLDTNGETIIGYYIVRNQRTDSEKTILDTGVLVPTMINQKYTATGLLQPELADTSKYNRKVYGLITPEHKFNNREISGYDYIKQQGNFSIIQRNKSKILYNDVMDGTSFNEEHHKGGNDDGKPDDGPADNYGLDGWSLGVIVRDNCISYRRATKFNLLANTDIEKIFYLSALESKDINDGATTVYNIAADNKIGIVELIDDLPFADTENLPYVVIGRNVLDSYSNFRILPYYKDSINLELGASGASGLTSSIFGGDTYVSPMRYTNTVFWDNRVAKRAGKTSAWKYIIGGVLIAIGVVALIFGGSGALIIGAGIAIIGAGATFIASGITMDAINKAYNEEYEKGLRETTLDDWVNVNYKNFPGAADGPSDDEIQWIGDCVTDLWMESTVNMGLRVGMITNTPTFVDAPGKLETGNITPYTLREYFGLHWVQSDTRIASSKLETHLLNKLTVYDSSRDGNRLYLGVPMGEYYKINPDYARLNSQKIFYHLPLEYDCCTDCTESFPHRIHYSEQSFQEELTDNYRIILPNNYRDIDGETGEIVNVFKINNDLFIHTLEALWQMPKNYQERVTDQIVSFIGTGSYFEIPPQKLLDDATGGSAGTSHKWSYTKTAEGYFFVSDNQKKIYNFNGKQLQPISNVGISNWFKENIEVNANIMHYATKSERYPYDDNTPNRYGTGFITTYDTKKERLLVTKKDFILDDTIYDNPDMEVCVNEAGFTVFLDYEAEIAAKEALGWTFDGVVDCVMQFSRDKVETRTETRTIVIPLPIDTVIVPFFDTTSMGAPIIANISATLNAWFPGFKASVNDGDNDLTFVNPGTWNNWGTEKWVIDPASLTLANLGPGLNILLLVFVDETNPLYHDGTAPSGTISAPSAQYLSDVAAFIAPGVYGAFASFKAINYPIVRNVDECKNYLQHAIAAIEATNMTVSQVNGLQQNPYFTTPQWNNLKAGLQANPYVGQPILKNYGWNYKENRISLIDGNPSIGCPVDGVSVLTPCTFTQDVEDFISAAYDTEEIEVDVDYIVKEYTTVEGVVIPNPISLDKSWTLSYSTKMNSWTSWHSYMPNFYINTLDKFYSWRVLVNPNYIWKHNKAHDYQTYYYVTKPHIIEYVSLSTPTVTRVWNHIGLVTEAKTWDPVYEQYVDQRFITFNKAIFYNSRQCSGLLFLQPKENTTTVDFFWNQTLNNNNGTIIIDRQEKDWYINDFRDVRVDYTVPVWDSNPATLQADYYIDKRLNFTSLNPAKDWTQLENFRDKYLVIRLIFDNFANVKLITNYSSENEQQSFN